MLCDRIFIFSCSDAYYNICLIQIFCLICSDDADRLACEGILVHEVRPGVIATDMTGTVKAKYDDLIAKGAFPIARWGQPEDVANAVSALCSDKFLYSTGNYIDIDGGFHIPRL